MMLRFRIDPTENFTEKEKERLEDARVRLEVCVNHPRFKELFFEADFHGELSEWKDKPREEIWDHLMSGAEVLQPEIDNEADIRQDIFNPNWFNSHVVGYTYGHTITQWINRKVFTFWKLVSVASNILHEWGHKLGFSHDHARTARRPFSICYQLNRILEKVWSEIFNEPMPQLRKSVPRWKRILFFWRY